MKNFGAKFYFQKGFALTEILVALFFVTMVIALIGGLAQQVAQFSKRSAQTGAILELRNMTNAITRKTDDWLIAMKSSEHTRGIFAGCIPDLKSNIETFSCPKTDTAFLADNDLRAISDNGAYHIASTPMVNSEGGLVAGTDSEPVYYTSEGRICNDADKARCSLKSTGFFLRSNSSTAQDPGSVKFVIKVETNPSNVAGSSVPMKAQYMTMDIGKSWKSSANVDAEECPVKTIKVGYYSNGKPACIEPMQSCPGNLVAIGIDSNNKTICRDLPSCKESGSFVGLNAAGTDLLCTATSPCGPNKLFLGYFAGSGEPMCSGNGVKCPSGHVQIGTKILEGTVKPECMAVKECDSSSERLVFNGSAFVCKASGNGGGSSASSSSLANSKTSPVEEVIFCKKTLWVKDYAKSFSKYCFMVNNKCLKSGSYAAAFEPQDCGGRVISDEYVGMVTNIRLCGWLQNPGIIQPNASEVFNIPGTKKLTPPIKGPAFRWWAQNTCRFKKGKGGFTDHFGVVEAIFMKTKFMGLPGSDLSGQELEEDDWN